MIPVHVLDRLYSWCEWRSEPCAL